MYKKIMLWIAVLVTAPLFSQNYIKHKVAKGETITSIAQKYKVTPFDIYQLNPDAKNGIQLDAEILIPKKNNVAITHEVQPKETMYSISKKYNTTQADLEKNNPILKTEGLQAGQILIISSAKPEVVSTPKPTPTPDTHTVQPKETKYGIATKYGMSIEELEKLNPEIKENLEIGTVLKLKSSAIIPVLQTTENQQTTVVNPKNLYQYTVTQGETFYSITHKFSISQASLIALNPELKEGVKEGMVLKVPASASVKKEQTTFKDLSKSISKQDHKNLVLFLPFNAHKIQLDSVGALQNRLKKDKFLNMTLDFYSGALMAIDSAKALGLNVNIKIYDSQENKNGTNAVNTINANDFSHVSAVIGPFYQANVEKVADALQGKNIPVISPLSKEEGSSYPNLFLSMPSNDEVKNYLFDYLHKDEGNIVALVDSKKTATLEYLNDNQNEIPVVKPNEKGLFAADIVKPLLQLGKTNYVIVDSDKQSLINSTITTLLSLQKEYKIQLVFLEPNIIVNDEDIDTRRFTKLKLLYPTVARINTAAQTTKFERKYRKKNNILPNTVAMRGFDLTFDVLQRLSQSSNFTDDLKNVATQQFENKFDYNPKVNGGYTNNGVFIEYYDTDGTIKQL